jgi:hypothetical protein
MSLYPTQVLHLISIYCVSLVIVSMLYSLSIPVPNSLFEVSLPWNSPCRISLARVRVFCIAYDNSSVLVTG